MAGRATDTVSASQHLSIVEQMGLMCQPATPAHDAPTPIEAPLRSGPHIPSDSGPFQCPRTISFHGGVALPACRGGSSGSSGSSGTWGTGRLGDLGRRSSGIPHAAAVGSPQETESTHLCPMVASHLGFRACRRGISSFGSADTHMDYADSE